MEKVDSSTLSITGALPKARRAVFSREASPSCTSVRNEGKLDAFKKKKKKKRCGSVKMVISFRSCCSRSPHVEPEPPGSRL